MSDKVPYPPPGYVQVPSQVDGIEVFAPAVPKDTRPDLVDFKCPNCGATIAYQVELGGLTCEYCGYTDQSEVKAIGQSAEEFEFTVDTIRRSQQDWGKDRREMACQRCGGVVSIPAETLSFSCPFCASNKVLLREPLVDVLRPRFLIPFQIDPTACRSITREWLGSSWMTPAELKNASPDRFHPVYIPYWTFDATANAAWSAQVGYERVEYSYNEKGERQERTVINWRPESGKVQNTYNDLLVPGTQRLNLAALGKIDAYQIQDLVRYEPRLLAGMTAQAYDLPLEKAWEAGRYILRERTREACRERIASPHVRNFKVSIDFSGEQWRYILVPVYTSLYAYREHTYQILINGQSGKINGARPVDWPKIWLVIAGMVSPGAVLGLLSLIASDKGTKDLSGGLGLFLLAAALVFAFFILKQAQEMEHE